MPGYSPSGRRPPWASCPARVRKLYSGGATASSIVTWKSWLNELPKEEYHGNVQPRLRLYRSSCSSGARET